MKPIELTLFQFQCELCRIKSYINKDDDLNRNLICPICGNMSKKIRTFILDIKSYKDEQ